VAIAIVMLAGLGLVPASNAQQATETAETPDVVIPGTGDADDQPVDATPEAEVTATEEPPAETAPDETEAPASTTANGIQVSATDSGNPAVIAHGLAFLTGEQSVWQVREVEPSSVDQAASEISNAAFVYQVEGTSIIRNDVTGKRALLDPGESLFKAGGDAYTTFADSDDSLLWVFELVGPSDVESDAFYESPLIDDYSEGVFDLLMIRYVLEPGETTTLPDRTGPALVMSVDGDIDIENGGLGLLATGDGQLIIDDATVTNNSDDPAVFVMTAFGSQVGDATSSTGTASPETTEDPPTETEADAEPATDVEITAEDTVTPEEPRLLRRHGVLGGDFHVGRGLGVGLGFSRWVLGGFGAGRPGARCRIPNLGAKGCHYEYCRIVAVVGHGCVVDDELAIARCEQAKPAVLDVDVAIDGHHERRTGAVWQGRGFARFEHIPDH